MATLCLNRFHWVIIILTCLQGRYCYLTGKPLDALRSIGESVTFTCNSTKTTPIRWWFTCDTCTGKPGEPRTISAILATDPSNNIHVTGQLGAGSPDGYRSTLTINSVTKNHEGIFRCQDGTGSRGFAQLTVTSSPKVTCMPVSPRDQIVTTGEEVAFTAARPTALIRYYHVRAGDPNSDRAELYRGDVLNDREVDERFSVIGVGKEGHADLVIRSVQPDDAGTYIAKDETEKSVEAAANLVVFDRSPECKQVWDVSAKTVTIHCDARYQGELTPQLIFLGQEVTGMCLQKDSYGGIIQCSLTINITDLLLEEETESQLFEIIFKLKRCGEFAGNWVWQHAISAYDIEARGTPMSWNKRHGFTTRESMIILVISSVLFILSNVGCIVSCVVYRKRQNTTGKGSMGENGSFSTFSSVLTDGEDSTKMLV